MDRRGGRRSRSATGLLGWDRNRQDDFRWIVLICQIGTYTHIYIQIYILLHIYPSSPRSILFIDIRYTMVYVYTFAHVPVSCPVTPHHLYLPVETC